jgi:hypothetical protein
VQFLGLDDGQAARFEFPCTTIPLYAYGQAVVTLPSCTDTILRGLYCSGDTSGLGFRYHEKPAALPYVQAKSQCTRARKVRCTSLLPLPILALKVCFVVWLSNLQETLWV